MTAKSSKYKTFLLKREKLIRLCRIDFWTFCKVLEPDFYTEDRPHLKYLCHALQQVYEGKLEKKDSTLFEKLQISMPPQHGKTRTLKNFAAWILGINPNEIIGYACYAKDLAIKTSRNVKALISKTRSNLTEIIYADIFPNTKLKRGHNTVQEWALEGRFLSFKTTSVEAQITGTGVTIRISDDLISGYRDALNENAKNIVWDWWTGTYISRRGSSKVIDIMCMTRWASDDPCGRVLKIEPDNWHVINLPIEKNGLMLCDEILSYVNLQNIKLLQPEDVFFANYYQEPVDIKNRVFNPKFYYDYQLANIHKWEQLIATIDPAHEGEDSFAVVVLGLHNNFLYVLDTVYTQDSGASVEYQVAEVIYRNKLDYVRIEKNNGGNVIGRNIEDILRDNFGFSCEFDYFTRTGGKTQDSHIIARGSKHARIISHSSKINNYVLFPENFPEIHTEAYNELIKYNRSGKNKHDDFCDVLSMAIEVKEGNMLYSYVDVI